jgi:hypothetical protein
MDFGGIGRGLRTGRDQDRHEGYQEQKSLHNLTDDA